MANPFKEAEKAKKKAPGSKLEHEVKEEKNEQVDTHVEQALPVEKTEVKPEVNPEVKTEVKAEAKVEKKVEKPAQPVMDIFANLEAEKSSGKTCSFYLSDDNISKLKKMAEKKRISTSKLLDHILSEVLK